MPSYAAPVRDTKFILDQVLEIGRYANLPGFEAATPDTIDAVLEEGGRFVSEVIAPTNQPGDQEGCTRHPDGSVTTPASYKDAYRQFVEGGWATLAQPVDVGGQGLPHVLAMAFQEYLNSANMAFAMYPGLTTGAIAAITAAGSDEQVARYVPPMVEGRWTGTMNLTEPQCGTDLGMIRTRAEPAADGSYRLTGTKIFISSGEHDLAENIVHLVLAKTPGAPDSVKGISLFIVPKFLVDGDGSPGARNGVTCGSIEHKMGIHGNSTCVMNYDDAVGYMVGEENKGLAGMFVMMNAARLGVGLQGLGIGEVAYQNAAAYAKDRRQGRALTGPAEPAARADPIIVHPDVRRMLMEGRAYNEGLRALILWVALLGDLSAKAPDEAERLEADDLVGLLTPVIKAYATDKGFLVANLAQQVLGGHGYVREWGLEQFVRDARIAQIYEGTNGVQAMDLVGRKLASHGGRALQSFLGIVAREVGEARAAGGEAAEVAERLGKALAELQAATLWLMANAMRDPNQAGAGAYPYMEVMGIVSVGLMWLRMSVAAQRVAAEGGEDAFLRAKLITARFFAERMMPDAAALRAKIEGGAEAIMALPAEAF